MEVQRLFLFEVTDMAVVVNKLYKNGTFLYKMNLIAGRSGLNNLVTWVHIIEDDSVTTFLHGNELVFTAGIMNKNADWLLNFARKLQDAGASAFVINIGPHTQEVPAEVIDYCNSISMPLFTIPWETKMVDMTRDFCHRIMQNEHIENNLATTIKNIIFKVGEFDAQVQQMERYGYQKDSSFCFVSISIKDEDGAIHEEDKDSLAVIAERIAKGIHELFISFTYKGCLNLVLANYADKEIEDFVRDLLERSASAFAGRELTVGISSNQVGFYQMNINFDKAFSALEMAGKLNETVCYYDRLGIYKVLYAVGDKAVLRSYHHETIGKLESYDRENKTQLTQLLRTYLENNGSLQIVSEKLYVHRNTVTNQLKKIEKIVGYNPLELEDRVRLYIGFYIQDIL